VVLAGGLPRSATGQLEPVWPGIDADMYGGWTPEGRVFAGALFTYSSLWRFTPNK
jgi:hypothetical protein